MKGVFVGLVLLAGASACGGSPPSHAGTPAAAGRAPSPEAGALEPATDDELPTLDALAARGPSVAPLMREALRVPTTSTRSADLRADKDLCVRAVFAAARPVRASFVDESGAPRGEAAVGASGSVPPRGPVCVKKGEALHLVVDGAEPSAPAAPARAVVFAAP